MNAILKFTFTNNEETSLIYKSLKPEIKHKIPKTEIEISKDKNKLELKINAQDTSSLRAACNSYLRWINTAYNVKKEFQS